jgi:hypothetical protein
MVALIIFLIYSKAEPPSFDTKYMIMAFFTRIVAVLEMNLDKISQKKNLNLRL